MATSALQDPLEAQRGLHLALLAQAQAGGRLIDVFLQFQAQPGGIRPAGTQHFLDPRGLEDRVQQVLHRQELMTPVARHLEGVVEAGLQFVRQHGCDSSW